MLYIIHLMKDFSYANSIFQKYYTFNNILYNVYIVEMYIYILYIIID